jgi:hypothetical protein
MEVSMEDDKRSAVGVVPEDMALPGPANGLGGDVGDDLKSLGSGEGSGEGIQVRTLDAIKEDAESPVVRTSGLPPAVDKPLPSLPKE